MSRSGKRPIAIPAGVEVSIDGAHIRVKGAKGQLERSIEDGVAVESKDNVLQVVVVGDGKLGRIQGLTRALVNNMVQGVSSGFEKRLEMIGVGFRAAVKGTTLELQLGFSHPTEYAVPDGILIKVDKNTLITVSGVDRQLVGQVAADIRAFRPPEPYKGKGVRYADEYVRRKAGKATK